MPVPDARFPMGCCRVCLICTVCTVLVFLHPGPHRTALALDTDNGLYGSPGVPESASELRRVRTLIQANALDLAQVILETRGPPVLPTELWQAWERQLWALYAARGYWQKLLERTRQIPPAFPVSIHRLADQHAATALIEMKQGFRARRILRKRLRYGTVRDEEIQILRRLIIRSYLADDMLPEASMAMGGYQLDYRSKTEDWLFLSAQINFRAGHIDQAINLTATLDFPSARLLNLYARIVDGSISREQAAEKLRVLAEADQSDRVNGKIRESEIAAVSAFLGQEHDDAEHYLSEVERHLVLTGDVDPPNRSRFPAYGLQDLLHGYIHYAEVEGNRAGLLAGAGSDWLDHALALPPDKLTEKKAIYGYLLQQEDSARFRFQVNNLFVRALVESGSMAIIPMLFGEAAPFGTLVLDGRAGLELSNLAIEQGNIQLAALINNSLAEIPREMDRDQWLLHSSRVSIIAGQHVHGARTLRNWLDEQGSLTAEQIDQVLQPVFDLQKVGQHRWALELLVRIWPRITTIRHQREVAYWIAESYQSTRQFLKAADYFLYSALLEHKGLDQWGESARYRAAESLQSARLYSDARTILADILRRSDNEQRNTQLRQRIQELDLLETSRASEVKHTH